MANVVSLDMFAGETRTITLRGRDASNDPFSLTGKTVTFYIGRPPLYPDDGTAIITKTATVTDAASGTFTVALAADDTTNMAGDYEFQARATTAGNDFQVICRGRFRVKPVLAP